MNQRERFLAACFCKATDRPPVWIMRQAGRYLPEYRELKSKYNFLTLVKTPELAAEVTLQPILRFPEIDAAITFSDILVIPEALGQAYSFCDRGGIQMDFTLDSLAQIQKLSPPEIVFDKLSYVAEAQKIIRQSLGNSRALLGFSGTPWTLATYMVEGGSSKQFYKIKALAHENPKAFYGLMEKLSDAIVIYLKMQIASGVDAIQLFDSWASLCTWDEYEDFSLRWIKYIVEQIPHEIPIILFPKGMVGNQIRQILETKVRVISVDWIQSLTQVRQLAGTGIALQGNLDPAVLNFASPEIVSEKTKKILSEMRNDTGFIFNLGHGIMPQAKLENVSAMLETIANSQRF